MSDCEANTLCQITQIKTNIERLFARTDDIESEVEEIIGRIACLKFISTEAELLAGLEVGGMYCVTAPFAITQKAIIAVPNTWVFGHPCSLLAPKITRQYEAGQVDYDIFLVKAINARIVNLELTVNHPLISGAADYGAAVNIEDTADDDPSGLIVENCNIHDVWCSIMRSGGAGSLTKTANNIRIRDNNIHNFLYGTYLARNFEKLVVSDNVFRGIDDGGTHELLGDAINALDGIDNARITGNRISNCNSSTYGHGIEFVNTPTDVTLAGRNLNPIIANNIIFDVTFGISVVGNGTILIEGNNINQAKGIGIECFNSPISLAKYNIIGNTIEDTRYHTGQADPSRHIAVDQQYTTGVSIVGNTFGKVTSPVVGQGAYGIEIVNGGVNTRISNNKFVDSGTAMIILNGNGAPSVRNTIDNNEFVYSPSYAASYPSPSYSTWQSIVLANFGVAIVKDNKVWYPSANPTFGEYNLYIAGTVYTGDDIDAPIVWSVNPTPFAQSNTRVAY